MTALQLLGAALIASPFIAMFAYATVELGWREAASIFAAVVGLVALIGVGSWLLTGGA
jgi:hypothetical protein